MEKPAILFIYNRRLKEDGWDPCFLWQAAEVGFRSYAVNWADIHVSDSGEVSICGGFEATLPHGKRYLGEWEQMDPSIVVHRKCIWGQSEELMAWLAQALPEAFISYHPLWGEMDNKWNNELCFRAGEHAGLHVPRPTTYLVENEEIQARLKDIGKSGPLIFKPSYGMQCDGIWTSTPDDFNDIAVQLPKEGWSSYVVQEIVDNPVLYHGKRFDMRIYASVTSFEPLRYQVCHEGVVRVASEDYDPGCPADYLRVLTGWSFLCSEGADIVNITVSELLKYLRGKGYRVDDFWDRMDVLFGNVFRCLVDHSSLLHEDSLQRRFLLTGSDVLMVDRDDSFDLLYLETNINYPGVWSRPEDEKFHTIYRQWLMGLWDLCNRNNNKGKGADADVLRAGFGQPDGAKVPQLQTGTALKTSPLYKKEKEGNLPNTHPTSPDKTEKVFTLALIDTGSQPLSEWTRGRNPELIRIARVLSREHSAEVLICPWYQVRFGKDVVSLRGPMLQVAEEQIRSFSPDTPKAAHAMLFYPASKSGEAGETKEEKAALKRLSSMGLVTAGTDRNSIVARIMSESSRRGIVTNAQGFDGRWGRKDQLEFALRSHTRSTGRKVPRPETFVVLEPQIPNVLKSFAGRGLDCVIKPANRARGEGVQIMRPSTPWEPSSNKGNFIIQELVQEPLLVNGHKADLRCYILIDTGRKGASRRLSPVFVRLASVPYMRGKEVAEITNTSYRRQLGLPPAIYPLEQMDVIPEVTRKAVLAGLDKLTKELIEARFWWAESLAIQDTGYPESRRVIVWGLDVIASQTSAGIQLYLLEVNVYPQLFRGSHICDRAVEDMLRYSYLPALLDNELSTGTKATPDMRIFHERGGATTHAR